MLCDPLRQVCGFCLCAPEWWPPLGNAEGAHPKIRHVLCVQPSGASRDGCDHTGPEDPFNPATCAFQGQAVS